MSELEPGEPVVPRTIEEYATVNTSLRRQLANVHSVKVNRTGVTILFFAMVTILFGTGLGLYVIVQDQQAQQRGHLAECLGRNANTKVAQQLYTSLSQDAQSTEFQLDFATAAAGIQVQDCSIYR